MQGFNFESTLTFPITIDVNQMKIKLDADGFPYTINYENNLVLYKIDNEKCIRLSYMLYLLEIKLIKITLAQYIQICLDIINKMFELNEKKISHNYLSADRIWLKFTSDSLTVMPQELHYKVYFVGYDCPFYERIDYNSQSMEDDSSVKQIVKSVLMFSRKYKKKKNLIIAEQKGIFKKLIDEGIEKHGLNQKELLQKGFKRQLFDCFIKQAKNIFIQYQNQNNKLQQLQEIDTEFKDNNFKRGKRIIDVQDNIKKLQNKFLTQNTHILQYQIILHNILPSIAKELRKAHFYSNQLQPDNETKIKIKTDLKEIDKNKLKTLIEQGKTKSQEFYKFTFDNENIELEISQQISIKFQMLDYFYNDCNYYIDAQNDRDRAIGIFKDENVKIIVDEYFDLIIQLNILQLIQSLI